MAKAPAPGSTRAPDQLHLAITIDGATHVFTPDALTARQIGDCRRQVGRPVKALLDEITDTQNADLDTLAAFVWLARLQAGEKNLTYNEVADAIGYDTDFDVETNAEAAEIADPEVDSPEA